MNSENREQEYKNILEEYKTKEEKLNYLKECKWQIQMIDHWTKEDRIDNEIVNKLIKEVEESDTI